jgi:homogentisate phytyltransferase/homogentisate geranylgeranyltransferase
MAEGDWSFSVFFVLSLAAALLCNVFITGYNQLVDIDLDKINKPNLPLPAGKISVEFARGIVFSSLIISLAIAGLLSLQFLALIGIISLLGFIYSWKSIYLKRYHQTAALAIIVVRGILINLGFYAHFSASTDFPPEIWTLTLFVVLFSAGIAWFKDIPDMEGDAQEKIGSLALTRGATKTFASGVWLLGLAYTSSAFAPLLFSFLQSNTAIVTFGHAALGIIFLALASRTNPLAQKQMKRFYLSFWVLFFLEYILWVLAFLL